MSFLLQRRHRTVRSSASDRRCGNEERPGEPDLHAAAGEEPEGWGSGGVGHEFHRSDAERDVRGPVSDELCRSEERRVEMVGRHVFQAGFGQEGISLLRRTRLQVGVRTEDRQKEGDDRCFEYAVGEYH